MTLTTYGTKIDLRDIPIPDRHVLVLKTYRLLEPGQTMELINDDDPRPLFHELQQRDPGGFGWDNVQAGAAAWRVRVVRLNRQRREDPAPAHAPAAPVSDDKGTGRERA